MKTRVQRKRLKELKVKLRFNDMFYVEGDKMLGGLGLFWKKDVLVEILEANMNYIQTICFEK